MKSPAQKLKDRPIGIGTIRIITSVAGEEIRRLEFHNMIMANAAGGFRAILEAMAGERASIEIDECRLGTGTTPPTEANTGLETEAVDDIVIGDVPVVGNKTATFQFFAPSADVPNGTYTEIGFFMQGDMWSRTIIDPSYAKASGEDTTIEYVINFENA